MSIRRLDTHELVAHCDPASLDLAREPAGTAPPMIGQERARLAVEFGIAARQPGFYLFVMGPPGSGRRSLAHRVI